MQFPRVVEILAGRESIGSGYLISPRHVLTARHVALARTGQACMVRPLIRKGDDLARAKRPRARAARVAWQSGKDQDLAILRLASPIAWIAPGPIRFACVPMDDRRLEGVSRGFPSAAGVEDRPIRADVAWSIVRRRFDVDLKTLPPADWQTTAWGGMSGAALFAGDDLIGVIRTADRAWIGGKLEATPIEFLRHNDAFAAFLAAEGLEAEWLTLGSETPVRRRQGWLDDTRQDDLLRILRTAADLPSALLTELYRNHLPPSAALRPDRSLQGIVAHLADLPLPADDRVPPLVDFIRDLSERRPALRAGVDQWLDRAALAVPGMSVGNAGGAPTRHRYFVAVVIEAETALPDPRRGPSAQPGRIASIRIWKEGAAQPLRDSWEPDDPVSLDDVRDELAAMLNRLQEQLPRGAAGLASTEIVIEFCLPHALLAEPVDEWSIPDDWDRRQPLGLYYPVVLRDTARPARIQAQRRWQERWTRLGQRPPLSIEQVMWLEQRDALTPDQLYDKLLGLNGGEPHVCIGFCFALPEASPPAANRDLLFAAWMAGLPAALWCRSGGPAPDKVRQELGRLLTGTLVHELPRRLWELRQAGRLPPVSLVWDDPGHIPYEPRGTDGGVE